jgi:hypothetical protein
MVLEAVHAHRDSEVRRDLILARRGSTCTGIALSVLLPHIPLYTLPCHRSVIVMGLGPSSIEVVNLSTAHLEVTGSRRA